jgi:ParE toxin of type II toxin-antitoxin system, parDE
VKSVIFATPASRELVEAKDRYDALRPGLGTDFIVEVDEILTRIVESPAQFPVWLDHPKFRKAVLPEIFPYVVFFEEIDSETILITAVSHGARSPGYWLDRRR